MNIAKCYQQKLAEQQGKVVVVFIFNFGILITMLLKQYLALGNFPFYALVLPFTEGNHLI